MIAEKIEGVIERWFTVMQETGVFPHQLFMQGIDELHDAARMARRLEAKPVPRRQRVVASTDPSDPVVDLASFRGRAKQPTSGAGL
ncbi:hypothetical protein T8K17_01915 [Thalassobaculum sp. OXR-137]|uniref:hypothetical protein n=1 Tax=Thalassobaculum sp. OXR-137 TaxID=3100173 RepID=UPI002AC94D18|nr:hypothetical protein [Thalassobaculum sp. OXR-137]WPZ33200.1 hypothetical protein T8K17_18400 [Thalassobaculum sp. OXR-137]WPZ34907.1 hypothetical protein T8K17_01915 [Thalassobaculum sp. OXR-137]